MTVEYEKESLRRIFENNTRLELVLPNFQRDFVWKREDQAKLLASFMARLPIGSLLLVKGESKHFAARDLCAVESVEPLQHCRFLLDGQQRLSSLKSIFSDLFVGGDSWKTQWAKLFAPLRNRWFIRIQPHQDEKDIWGWKLLKFSKDKLYDPSDIEEFIVVYKIFASSSASSSDPYHPSYAPQDSLGQALGSEESKRLKLARIFAEGSIVPLYEVYSSKGDSALHSLTLKQIASNRRDELRAQVERGELPISEVLGHLEPDIHEIWGNRDNDINKSKLSDLWAELFANWQRDLREILEGSLEQEILETVLPYNEIDRASAIFETINKGGTPLNTFDLMVARVAVMGSERSLADRLREEFEKSIPIPSSVNSGSSSWSCRNFQVVSGNTIVKAVQDHFLNLLSVTCYSEKDGISAIKVEHIKQSKILNLDSQTVTAKIDVVVQSLIRAYAFLQFRCGTLSVGSISYRLMVIPIAYLLSHEDIWNSPENINRIEYWYWSSLFSGSYREKQNERVIQDLNLLNSWIIQDTENPFQSRYSRILDDPNYSDRSVLLLETPEYEPAAAIKSGILEYILSRCPRDFKFEDTAEVRLKAWEIASSDTEKLEDHHVIPLGTATKIGQSSSELRKKKGYILNSPLNRTYISQEANRQIRDFPPDQYLQKLQDITLYGHSIPANVVSEFHNLAGESEEDKYKRILAKRYEEIRRDIKWELDQLIS